MGQLLLQVIVSWENAMIIIEDLREVVKLWSAGKLLFCTGSNTLSLTSSYGLVQCW